ncbi:MAG: glycosyltransferase [Clostridia bacterium]|nr:glycosyltransferase [Clostridia bacterium]
MSNEKISIIVPVYKVEQYLNKCVNSIINQTYKNLEIILVDDGSPDNCPKMCDDWAKKDGRIKVIHKQNGGVANARNVGIDSATGKYVGFVDSDDFIHPTMYEKLIDKIKKENADICACRFCNVYEDNKQKNVNEIFLEKLDSNNIITYLLTNTSQEKQTYFESYGIMGSVCRLLIKKSSIGDLRFENLKITEDLLFLLKLIKPNTKISVITDYLYYYFQRTSSAMHNFNKNKIEERYKAFKIILKEIENKVDKNTLNRFKFYNYASLANEMLKNNQLELLKEYLKDDIFVGLNTKETYKAELKNTKNFKRKVGYFLVHKKMFRLYSFLIKKV